MKLDIVKYPDPVLEQTAVPVDQVDDEIRALVADMVETMYADKGVGLAAPQVGRSIRLITVDESGPENKTDLMVLVNPEIVEKEGEVDSDEACLSVVGAKCTVKRAEKVTVKALDQRGEPVTIHAEGMLAIILQHEIDHLEGTLIIDHISRFKRSLYDKKVKKWIKQNRI